jgi:hypothetical protein
MKIMSKFDKMTQRKFISPKPRNYPNWIIDPFTFHHAIEDKVMYEDSVKECINYQMKKEFQLQAYSEIQYCDVEGRIEEIGKFSRIFFLIKA